MTDVALDRFCPACGYNLRGVTSDRCPECGTPFDPNAPQAPQIPWSNRAQVGRFKAFWRTVRLANFNGPMLGTEMHRHVVLADALSFRRRVVWCAFVPLALLAACSYGYGLDLYNTPWVRSDRLGSLAQWIGLPVLLASVWLFLLFATGVHSYFFHPGRLDVRQQNRAVALSYYAAAPWAYLALPMAMLLGFIAMAANNWLLYTPIVLSILIGIVLIGPIAIELLLIWLKPALMLRRITHTSWLGTTAMIVLQPILLALCAVLSIGVINLVYWFGVIVVMSFY